MAGIALAAGAARAASDTVTLSGGGPARNYSLNGVSIGSPGFYLKGSLFVNGASEGAFSSVSNDPLVAADDLSLGASQSTLSQPDTIVLQTAIISPYASYSTLATGTVANVAAAPYLLDFTLPGTDFATIGPVVFDVSAGYISENFKFAHSVDLVNSRQSAVVKYKGSIIADDPSNEDDVDLISVSGTLDVVPEDGGWVLDDAGSFNVEDNYDIANSKFYTTGNQYLVSGRFTDVTLVTGSLPEPSTWTLMFVGVGVAGGALRRRSRLAVTPV